MLEGDTFTVTEGGAISNVNHTVYVGFPQDDVNEPNDSITDFTDEELNSEIAGIIDPEGDSDFFRFRALRGTRVRIEVESRRLETTLVPLLILHDSFGREIVRNSNFPGLGGDARIELRLPAGGFYFVEVRDLESGGSPGAFYRLTIDALEQVVPLLPDSDLTPVLSFALNSASVGRRDRLAFRELNLLLNDNGPPYGDFRIEDLEPIQDSLASGISVFNNIGPLKERLDEEDERLPLESFEIIHGLQGQTRVILVFRDDSRSKLPLASTNGPDYHIAIRTSQMLHFGDDFTITVPANGIRIETDDGTPLYFADEPFPQSPTLFTGDLVEIVNMAETEQRIGLDSPPTAMLGINAVGDPAEGYYISQVKLLVIGYSARNFVPFLALTPSLDLVPGSLGDSLPTRPCA